MAISDILKQIESDAKARGDALLANAGAEADSIREKTAGQAEELRAQDTRKAHERADEHAARIETLAGLELRKDALRQKKDLIDDAFAMAENKIASLPPDEYRAFLKPIILGAVESANEELIPPAGRRQDFTPEFIRSLNDEIAPTGRAINLSAESGDFTGGFILRDGKKETNLTLKSLMTFGRDRLEPQVAKILFALPAE